MIPIVYGYPTPELWDEAEAGKVVIGGCVIYEGLSPTKVCRECGAPGWSMTHSGTW